MPFRQYMPPFDVTVVSSLDPYAPENTPPKIENFVDKLELIPGQALSVSLGRPVDIEEDAFYVSSWQTLIDGEVAVLNWVTFQNATSPTMKPPSSIDFSFNPPEDTQGLEFILRVTLQDKDERSPEAKNYDTAVSLKRDYQAFVPVFDKVDD